MMNKLITWLGAGTMAISLWACGGKVVVDAGGGGDSNSNGGAGGLGQGGDTTTGPGGPSCGDIALPSPAELVFCGGTGSATSGGMTSCEQDVCDASDNVFASVCSGSSCACIVNGLTKCTCATTSTNDICASNVGSCCPWVVIPL